MAAWTPSVRSRRLAIGISLQFPVALPLSEIRVIARSAATWTWRRFSDEIFTSCSGIYSVLGCCVRWRTTASTFSVEGGFAPIALDIQFQDRGMVDEAVYGRQRHSLIGEDAPPLAERLIGRYEQRSPLITRSD